MITNEQFQGSRHPAGRAPWLLLFVLLPYPSGCTNSYAGGTDATTSDTTLDAAFDLHERPESYLYLRLADLASTAASIFPGSRVDAIELRKAGTGEVVYAADVVEVLDPSADIRTGASSRPEDLLGEPDLECWQGYGATWPLGGEGGSVVVMFPTPIEPGDTIVPIGDDEHGEGCAFGKTEPLHVAISVSRDLSPDSFVEIGVYSATVPSLP